jgi:hypothetical protein
MKLPFPLLFIISSSPTRHVRWNNNSLIRNFCKITESLICHWCFNVIYGPLVSLADIYALLWIGTVAMGCKSLWPWAIGPSLLLHRYSSSIVETGRRRSSLLWSIVVMNTMTSAARGYYRPYQWRAPWSHSSIATMIYSSDGWLTSRCPSLLWSIVATSGRRHYTHRYYRPQ